MSLDLLGLLFDFLTASFECFSTCGELLFRAVQLGVLGVQLLAENFIGPDAFVKTGGFLLKAFPLGFELFLFGLQLLAQGLRLVQFVGRLLTMLFSLVCLGFDLFALRLKFGLCLVQFGTRGFEMVTLFRQLGPICVQTGLLFVQLLSKLIEFSLSSGQFFRQSLGLFVFLACSLGLLTHQLHLVVAFLLPLFQLRQAVFQLIEQALDL